MTLRQHHFLSAGVSLGLLETVGTRIERSA